MQTHASTAGDPIACGMFSPATDPDQLPPGAKAGPWVVERELGRGGMGSVYAVVHDEIGKRAALKVMHRRLVTVSSAERILLEARVVNQVGHPNIVDIFETGTLPDGRPYIVMERLDGVALSVRADENKLLPDQAIGILLQVCDALMAAHNARIVHRDLKLDNIFLIDNPDDPSAPRVKLLDWGIAKVVERSDMGGPGSAAGGRRGEVFAHALHHTIEGQLVGTPQYIAPEQARGGEVSSATDVYSLGVVAYELFLEQLPFQAETSAEIMAMHLHATPPPPRELWPDIPRALEELLVVMLAKSPDDRPSVLAVARALEAVRDELASRRQAPPVAPLIITPSATRVSRAAGDLDAFAAQATRWRSAPSLAPTELAALRGGRRWQYVIGAVAIAAIGAMYVLTRDRDSAAAPPSQHAAIVVPATSAVPHVAATPGDLVVADQVVDPTSAGDDPPRRVGLALDRPSAPPFAGAARPGEAGPGDPPKRVEVTARPHSSRPIAPHKHPVKPRRDVAIDPDGTIDPY
jgi:serine/threonine-protein kinase